MNYQKSSPSYVECDAPSEQPIPEAITRLRHQIAEANGAFDCLRSRLEPVLQHATPQACGDQVSKAERPPVCDYHSQLTEMTRAVQELTAGIYNATSRLAL